jgi:hypothetical protein
MSAPPASARRWLVRIAVLVAVLALVGIAWDGYRAGASQSALAALWSLCAPVR